ncbi:MAG: hypothetical protein JXA69_14035 [Phycisphaerae bacterium]|nr:hypothetical protein [Phycisphaerae bacterium]
MWPRGQISLLYTERKRVLLGVIGAILIAGCVEPTTGPVQIAQAPLEPNVIEIATFFSANPFGPVGGSSTPGGFRIGALYLMAPNEQGQSVGVFADGIIHVYLYSVEKDAEGMSARHLVRDWTFDPVQAMPYRAKKATVLGYGYQLHCVWGDADVLGRDVEIEVHFARKDGRLITSTPKAFKVPKA